MERRALIAVVISLLILVIYQEGVLRYLYPPPPADIGEAAPPPRAAEEPKVEAPPAKPDTAEPAHPTAALKPSAPERLVTVETDLYSAVFTTAGARLKSFRLKRYRTTVDPDSPPQEIIIPGQGGNLPFGVELRGTEPLSDAGAGYSTGSERLALLGEQTGAIEFTWDTGNGTVSKRFTFTGNRYDFEATVGARGAARGRNELSVSWDRGVEHQVPSGAEAVFDRTLFLDGRKLHQETFDQLEAGKVLTGAIEWAGYTGRHFLAAMIPVDAPNDRLWLKSRHHSTEAAFLFPISGDTAEQRLIVYVGPKDIDTLDVVGHSLTRAVDLGWFDFIALPMLHALKFIDRYAGNYGVAIIVLTVVIKLLFIPLTQTSFRSMQAMQKLQPQMLKIRERYKDNSEQMNKEIMELYRRHKVNPLGGCLPMVLQIPVFIGLYQALLNAVELRHAPFMLWINDLSAPDRLGTLQLPLVQHPGIPVLTLLMGASMFVQQWMTPTAGDPAQQRVMMIMPLMFTFMFVNFPSGLALYWLVNNLLTIGQQYYMSRSTT